MTTTMTSGIKYDQGKPRPELLHATFLEDMARVLAVGAEKYSDDNWKQVRPWKRYLGAFFRHAFAILRGELYDKESGLQHAAHAACNLMFIHWFIKEGVNANDVSVHGFAELDQGARD